MDTPLGQVGAGRVDDMTQQPQPQLAILDFFFPGFSVLSGVVQKYLHVDLNLYIPLVLLVGCLTFAWRYFSEYMWDLIEQHLMSTVDVRQDDETYNWLMSWVATQKFAQRSRRFVVNTNLNSRNWFLWWRDYDDEDEEGDEDNSASASSKKKKPLQYTPTFGSHFFWFNGKALIFRRSSNRESASVLTASEREEISVSCFGRNPTVLKDLLLEARELYLKRDESKTTIFRGGMRAGSTDPTWQKCMARTPRPFETVILNEEVKQGLIDDVSDYLNPATRRWYANRGIPYRRGYLLHGPPGTGKSSLSLALAGFFKMRIYIVSLTSQFGNEQTLADLFAELPRRCVVLLEDIDSAGLTHTREEDGTGSSAAAAADPDVMVPGQITKGNDTPVPPARLSLSGLLNILDGVASQEGRVLVMTTNHVEKLDKALIRPGRVDRIVEFGLADSGMIAALFRAIYAPLDDDIHEDFEAQAAKAEKAAVAAAASRRGGALAAKEAEAARLKAEEEEVRVRAETVARVEEMAREFAAKIPAHEFSPAEIQGFLLTHKREPEAVVKGAEEWVVETRKQKKEKVLKEAEEKRKKEAEEKKKKEEEAEKKKKEEEEEKQKKEEEEKKKKEEEDKKKKEEDEEKKRKEKTKKKRSSRHRRSKRHESDSESSASESGSASESEEETKKRSRSSRGKRKGGRTTTESKPGALSREDTIKAAAPAPAATDVPVVVVEEVKTVGGAEDNGQAPMVVTVVTVLDKEKKGKGEEAKSPSDSGYGTP